MRDKARSTIACLLANRSPATAAAYQRDLAAFAAFCQLPSAAEAVRYLLAGKPGRAWQLASLWKGRMQQDQLAPSTINRRLAVLRSTVATAYEAGHVSWTLRVRGVRVRTYRDTRGPGLEAIVAMLKAARGRGDAIGWRDAAIIWLLFTCGLRRNELLSLDLEHIDLAGRRAFVLAKGYGDRQWIDLPLLTADALAEWIMVRGTEPGPLFPQLDRAHPTARLSGAGLYHVVRRLGARAGVRTSPHRIRHAAISTANRTGRNTLDLQSFSRHADARVLSAYTDNVEDAGTEIADELASALASALREGPG